MNGPRLGFCHWGREIPFCGTSPLRVYENTIDALRASRRRACDVIRLRHSAGELYYLNLLSLGFPAEVGETANRRFKRWGELGYIFAVLRHVINLEHGGVSTPA